jgi:hypothetical protein
MAEKTKNPETASPEAKSAKEKSPSKAKTSESGAPTARSLSDRVERSLKDADRLMKKSPEAPPQEKAMAQLEQAKVSALLQLAEAIRENRKR